jgi:hypothetical protein
VAELAELWGAPVEADWRRLLELPDVELAYVFAPHDRMAEACLALIERRIPFVVEKPLGTSLEQLQRVRRAAAQARVPATVPLIQRGGPADSWLAKAGRRSSAPLPRPKGRSRAAVATQRLLDRILKAAALPTHEQEGRQWASHATKAAPRRA